MFVPELKILGLTFHVESQSQNHEIGTYLSSNISWDFIFKWTAILFIKDLGTRLTYYIVIKYVILDFMTFIFLFVGLSPMYE